MHQESITVWLQTRSVKKRGALSSTSQVNDTRDTTQKLDADDLIYLKVLYGWWVLIKTSGNPACRVFRALAITQSQVLHHMQGWVLHQCTAEFDMSSIRPDAPFALLKLQMQALSLATCVLKQHSWHFSAVLMKPLARAKSSVVFQRPEASPWLRRVVGLQLSQQTEERWARPIFRPNPGLITLGVVVTLDPCLSN